MNYIMIVSHRQGVGTVKLSPAWAIHGDGPTIPNSYYHFPLITIQKYIFEKAKISWSTWTRVIGKLLMTTQNPFLSSLWHGYSDCLCIHSSVASTFICWDYRCALACQSLTSLHFHFVWLLHILYLLWVWIIFVNVNCCTMCLTGAQGGQRGRWIQWNQSYRKLGRVMCILYLISKCFYPQNNFSIHVNIFSFSKDQISWRALQTSFYF